MLDLRGSLKLVSYTTAGNPFYRLEYAMRDTMRVLPEIYRDPSACLEKSGGSGSSLGRDWPLEKRVAGCYDFVPKRAGGGTVDATVRGAVARKGVRVQVPPRAQ